MRGEVGAHFVKYTDGGGEMVGGNVGGGETSEVGASLDGKNGASTKFGGYHGEQPTAGSNLKNRGHSGDYFGS